MSLFNTIMAEVENGNSQSEASTNESSGGTEPQDTGSSEPSWWWDKSTPGSGDRPDWLPSQFKSAEDAARSYQELSKKVGTAPDAYDWSAGEGWIEPEYEPMQELAAFAKSKHVPQDVFDKMLGTVGKYLDEFKIDYNEEKAALGENVEERLKTINNWAKSNFTEDTFHALTASMQTADAVKAIEEIRSKMIENMTTIPTGNEDTGAAVDSLEDIQSEMASNFEKYQSDAKYRKEITAKIEKASLKNNGGFVDKNY